MANPMSSVPSLSALTSEQTTSPICQPTANIISNEVFSALWQSAEVSVFRFVVSLVGRRSTADEIVQEVAYICLKQWATYEQNRNFTAWALGIARLEIFTHRRRQILLPISEIPELEMIMGDPDRHLRHQHEERHRALEQCMNKLADHQKRILEQRYGRGHSYEEMSGTLRIQMTSLKAMLSHIRKLLRDCINQRLAKTGE